MDPSFWGLKDVKALELTVSWKAVPCKHVCLMTQCLDSGAHFFTPQTFAKYLAVTRRFISFL